MKDPSPWTPERTARLRDLWATGMRAAAIAAELGVGKNAVLGRVHRMLLPARPSPIKGEMKQRKPRAKVARNGVVSLALLAKPAPPAPEPPSAERPILIRRFTGVPLASSMPIPAPRCCQWPMGELRTPGFRFCEAPNVSGRPYCGKHMAKAYQPRRTLAEKSEAQAQAERVYAARAATLARRSPRTQWQASEA